MGSVVLVLYKLNVQNCPCHMSLHTREDGCLHLAAGDVKHEEIKISPGSTMEAGSSLPVPVSSVFPGSHPPSSLGGVDAGSGG